MNRYPYARLTRTGAVCLFASTVSACSVVYTLSEHVASPMPSTLATPEKPVNAPMLSAGSATAGSATAGSATARSAAARSAVARMVPIGPVSALAVNALMVPVDASPVWTASARCPWPVSATLPAGTTWPSSATWPVSVTWPVSALAVQIGTISLLSTPAPAPSSQVLRLPLSAHTLETSLSQGTLMLDVLPPAFISTRSQAPVHVKTKPVPSKTITRPAHIAQVTEKPPVKVATRPTPKVPVKTTVHASASASTTIANIVGAPANLIPVYQAAGHRYGIPWTVLAAIHKTETDFATSNCAVSTAGAQGPMQFLPATFAAYGVAAPGHSGSPNINNVDDAIYTAAHMLAADGYQTSPSNAIFAYNHSRAYVRQIETLAGI